MIAWMNQHPVLASIVAFLVVYPFALRMVEKAAWPVRARLADDIGNLEHDHRLPSDTRKSIKVLGDHAFSWWMMPALALVFPFLAVERLVSTKVTGLNPLSGFDADTQKRIDHAVMRFVASAAARNPIFATIFAVEVAIVAATQIAATRLRQLIQTMSLQPAPDQGNGRMKFSSGQTVRRTLFNAVGRFDGFLTRLN
jgi:hypothetical protein